MARPRTNIPLRYFYRRQPMLMVEKSIACQTRWVTSSMTPNASCTSISNGVKSSSRASGPHKKHPRLITKNRMDINMKWWQIQFPEEETPSTPLAISPDGRKTLIDWMETIESNKRFPFQYRLSPKMSLDDYIADDLGVPYYLLGFRNFLDCLDEEQSIVTFWTKENAHFNPLLVGNYKTIDDIVISRTKTLGVDAFRLLKDPVEMFVSENFVREFYGNSLSGAKFTKIKMVR